MHSPRLIAYGSTQSLPRQIAKLFRGYGARLRDLQQVDEVKQL